MKSKTIILATLAIVSIGMVAICLEKNFIKEGRSSSPGHRRPGYSPSKASSNNAPHSSSEKGKKKLNSSEVVEVQTSHKSLIRNEGKNHKSSAGKTDRTNNSVAVAKNEVCTTKGCNLTAEIFLKNMDKDVKPCEDFYAFACGGFVKTAKIRDDRTMVNIYSIVTDIVDEQKKEILSEPINKNDIRPFRLVKELYATCMNTKKIEELKLQPALDFLKELGGWPVLIGHSWNEDSFNWRDLMYKFRAIGVGVDYLIEFGITLHPKQTTKRVLYLDDPGLGLSREFLIKGIDEVRVKYYFEYMVDVAVLFGADRDRAEKELMKSLEFAMELSHITLSKEDRRDVNALYNPMTIEDLQRKFPIPVKGKKFDWLEYVNTLLAPFHMVEKDEVVIVKTPKYFKQLAPILEKTPKRVIANYLIWRALRPRLSDLNQEAKKVMLAYSKKATGKVEETPRWEECGDDSFSLALGSMYVRKYFSEESKKQVTKMAQNIRKEMRKKLKTTDWMDEKTRKSALKKEEKMAFHIAYPDELVDDEKLTEFYKDVKIYPDEHFKTNLACNLFSYNRYIRKFRETFNKTDWTVIAKPLSVNAYFMQSLNSMKLPAAILQHLFYSADRPEYVNYGAIGYNVGHEVTHALDDQGCNYDENGDLNNWWEPETKTHYLKKVKCIIDQYGRFENKEHNLTLNGLKCQGEAVADNGGVRNAYDAYKTWAEKHKKAELKLPGLEKFTPHQLFWISVANMECEKYRSESLRNLIMTGVHPPGEYRLIGALSNQKAFSEDFQCSPKSKMNPSGKCVVW